MIISFKCIMIILISIFAVTKAIQPIRLSELSDEMDQQWSFVSQIHTTWLQNIIKQYFSVCSTHQQLKALYNCNTTTEKYLHFWKQFLLGIQLIKFKQQAIDNDNHQWSNMMIQAAKQWITVNKTFTIIEIQQAYQDIKDFPNNLMEFAQFYTDFETQFQQMKKLTNWQRTKKSYLVKNNKDDQQMQKDQMKMVKKYFDRKCFNSQDYMTECKMPLQRYSYYMKDMFFYFFTQPEKYSHYDQSTQLLIIDPLIDYKITKLWRDMRQVMRKHLNLNEQITLEEVQQVSVDILQSVMESLVRKDIQKSQRKSTTEQDQNQQL